MPTKVNFDKTDLISCFLLLEKRKSRSFLKSELGIGEGSIRTILDILKEDNLILSSNQGHIHSKKGRSILQEITSKISIPKTIKDNNITQKYFPLYPKDTMSWSQLFDYGKKLENTHLLRDISIKSGADGAILLYSKEGSLTIPDSEEPDLSDLKEHINPKKEGIIIIVIAKDPAISIKGVLIIIDSICDIFSKLRSRS